jgi:gluconate 2-dehydrogenase gamma chain
VSEMNRRQAITALAAMSATLGIPVSILEAATKQLTTHDPRPTAGFDPRFFTATELATATMLMDMIIPKDGRSGSASDAKVPEYMDFICAEYQSTGEWMRKGLVWLDAESKKRWNGAFTAGTVVQRGQLLDAIAWPAKALPEVQEGVTFFNRFRDLTASGFWSSQVGVQDLGYQGNTFVREWTGCPPEAKAKIGAN